MSPATLTSPAAQPATRAAITWDRLVELEPRLDDLLEEARRRGQLARETHGTNCDANGPLFGYPGYERPSLKDQLSRLVGWGRTQDKDSTLTSSAAYDLAVNRVLDELEAS